MNFIPGNCSSLPNKDQIRLEYGVDDGPFKDLDCDKFPTVSLILVNTEVNSSNCFVGIDI